MSQVGIHAVLGADLDADALYAHFRAMDSDFPLLVTGAVPRVSSVAGITTSSPFSGLPAALFSRTVRARSEIVAALEAQAARAAASESSSDRDRNAVQPGRFHPDVSPLLRARWEHYSEEGITGVESAAITSILVWALHANTAAALFWAAAHVYSGSRWLRLLRPLLHPGRYAPCDDVQIRRLWLPYELKLQPLKMLLSPVPCLKRILTALCRF